MASTRKDPAATSPGPLVGGRYRLGRVLGAGAQGRTYVAVDEKTGNHVAVKVFSLKDVKEWKELDLFRRESKILKQLDHPGIPHFLDEFTSEDGGHLHLVMELVPGQNLREMMRTNGPLSEAQLWRTLWQMAQVLEFLHGRNPPVVHRDIKPHNILMRDDGHVVLVDFGVVQEARKSDGGTFVGTYGFMAPEQFHGDSSPASDVYGLGATLIALGTGVEPEELPHEGLRLKFADRLQVSPPLLDILTRMVEPEPARRPRNGMELRALLEAGVERAPRPEPDAPFDEGDSTLGPHVPPPVAMVMAAMLMAVGMLGSVVLTVIGTVLVPMVFMVLRMAMPDKRRMLEERHQDVQEVLRLGSASFRQLAGTSVKEMSVTRRRMGARSAQGRLGMGNAEDAVRKARDTWRRQEEERQQRIRARQRGGTTKH